jgi:NADH:ubiquinone oxidoreductase subunit 3 (subunit A)
MIEYSFIGIMLLITFLLGTILLVASYYLVPKSPYLEKTSAYESGFEPFSSSRSLFLVSFYLVALLFLLFDLEITTLLPFAVIAGYASGAAFFTAFFFFMILTLGFVYELLSYGIEFVGDMTNSN